MNGRTKLEPGAPSSKRFGLILLGIFIFMAVALDQRHDGSHLPLCGTSSAPP